MKIRDLLSELEKNKDNHIYLKGIKENINDVNKEIQKR